MTMATARSLLFYLGLAPLTVLFSLVGILILPLPRPWRYQVIIRWSMLTIAWLGIACGFLISAIHQAGLATLTHTPSPMGFLTRVLQRPAHERPFLLLPVGYPAENAVVPVLTKKTLGQVSVWRTGDEKA